MHYQFNSVIYKVKILFICDHKEWVKQVKHYECPQQPDPLTEGWASVTRLPSHSNIFLVRAQSKEIRSYGPAECADTAAHEATHLMRFICDNVGESCLGWEAEAHLVGALTKWLFNILWFGKPIDSNY